MSFNFKKVIATCFLSFFLVQVTSFAGSDHGKEAETNATKDAAGTARPADSENAADADMIVPAEGTGAGTEEMELED